MTTFRFHIRAQSVNVYWCFFAISAVRPSPGLIFVILLLPCAWEIDLWVYQLWRMDFLWICWFAIISNGAVYEGIWWYMKVYEGIWRYMKGYMPWEVSHLFSHQVSRRMHSKSCLGTPWGPSYEHFCKNIYLCKGWIGW